MARASLGRWTGPLEGPLRAWNTPGSQDITTSTKRQRLYSKVHWTSISAIRSQARSVRASSDSGTYFHTAQIYTTLPFHLLTQGAVFSPPPSFFCHSPGTLWAALTLRLPLRVDSDANTHGVWGCGTVSMETTIWVVRTETFWKQEVALHMFSWKEVCTPSQWTLGWDDFPR